MASRFFVLLFLAASMPLTAARAAVPASPMPDRIRISIKNEYAATLNFGVLGKGSREGTDRAEGVLTRNGSEYQGIVTAVVVSTQAITGLGGVGNCGPAHYEDSQKLNVTGFLEDGFNPHVQTVDLTAVAGQISGKYLRLTFIPEMPPTQVPADPPGQDKIVNCHTLIEVVALDDAEDEPVAAPVLIFLPLNDTRWTTQGEGGGYIIALPSSGTISYTDVAVPIGAPAQIGPFTVNKSLWTIEVERLP